MEANNGGSKVDRLRLSSTLTIYGRNAVEEAFHAPSLCIDRLHLASSNKPNRQLSQLQAMCEQRNIPVLFHDRRALSRISRNGKQDQGIAADIYCEKLQTFENWLAQGSASASKLRIIALEGVTNPQNLGMCIRSCHGAGVDAILLSSRGSSGLSPLVIKASAGTAFTAPLVLCEDFTAAIVTLHQHGVASYAMCADAKLGLFDVDAPKSGVFILGNESEGVSAETRRAANASLGIPLQAPVESLNVAVAAALVAYAVCHL